MELSHFSPPLPLPPFPLCPDNLGLMDPPVLLPLLLISPPPSLFTQTRQYQREKGRLSPPTLPPPLPSSLPPSPQHSSATEGEWILPLFTGPPPCFLPLLHTFPLMPREALDPGCNPLCDQGVVPSAQPSPATARPDQTRPDTSDLHL